MKFNYKLNLGNIVGAAINAVPELQSKVNPKDFSDITIEGSAEYTIAEAKAIIEESKQLIIDLPDIIAIAAIKMKNTYDVIQELNGEEEELANSIEEIIATYNKAQDENRNLQNELVQTKDEAKRYKEQYYTLRKKLAKKQYSRA